MKTGLIAVFRRVVWRRPTPAERYYQQLDIAAFRKRLEGLEKGKDKDVSIEVLLQVATLRDPSLRLARDKRLLGEEFLHPLRQKWQHANQGPVAVFPPVAVIALQDTLDPNQKNADPRLSIALSAVGAPEFNWREGRELLNRVDRIGELARAWFARPHERIPHLERAWGLATQIVASVDRETQRRRAMLSSAGDAPSDALQRDFKLLRTQVDDADKSFIASAKENAQNIYVTGMFLGAVLLAVAAGIGVAIFLIASLRAVIGIGFVTGGLGAVISVLQRLGRLEVDYQAPHRRIRLAGGARPFLGAAFGSLIYPLLQSHLLGDAFLTAPSGTGPSLAFYGVIGFLAGFNERIAKDVVSTSAKRISAALG